MAKLVSIFPGLCICVGNHRILLQKISYAVPSFLTIISFLKFVDNMEQIKIFLVCEGNKWDKIKVLYSGLNSLKHTLLF